VLNKNSYFTLVLVAACSSSPSDTGNLDSGSESDTGTETAETAETADSQSDSASSDSADSSTDTADSSSDTGDNNPINPDGEGPAPVDLGPITDLAAPGSYVLLAKAGITNVTGSSITGGHLGISPAHASYITGFSLVADPSNEYSTSFAMVSPGRIYAADYATPTPENLTAAVLWMESAYVDAAGRSHPDFLDLESGNLGGLTLEPGLYTWGTSVTVPDDVTISGGAEDVWIFQISNDLDISTARSVILSGGARASNIFWQVAGQVTIRENAHFEGVILSKTAVTLQTTASFNGRAFAQTMIALDDNDLTAP
jgi:hypothetical protein